MARLSMIMKSITYLLLVNIDLKIMHIYMTTIVFSEVFIKVYQMITIGKGKVCGASQVAHQAGAYPGFL